MAKRSSNVRYSDVEENFDNEYAASAWKDLEAEEVIEYTELVLLKDVKLTLTGGVTGVQYIWNGAGSSVLLDKRDADLIIQKDKQRESCCGSRTSKYFEVRS